MNAGIVAPAQLRGDRVAAQQRIHRFGHVGMDSDLLAIEDLDDDIERRRRLALQDALLRASAARFLVAEGHGLDAADQVRQRRVEHQVVEVVAMGRADQLDAALGDGPGGLSLQLGPDLIDDDDLGHVVLDCLDHDLVLDRRRLDLHPARSTDRRVRDVAVAGDLVARVDHHDTLALVVGEDAGGFTQHRGLADARPAHDQDRLTGLDEVVDYVDRAVYGTTDAARQTEDLAGAITNRADAVERPFDARAVVVAECADVVDDVLDIGFADLPFEESDLAFREARFGLAAEIHDDFDQLRSIGQLLNRSQYVGRESAEEQAKIIDQLAPTGCRALISHISSCYVRLAYCRDESGFGHAHDGLLHQEGHRVEADETGLFETAVDRRFVGSNGSQDAIVGAAASSTDAGAEQPEAKANKRSHVGLGLGQDLEVVGLLLTGNAELQKCLKVGGAVVRCGLDVSLHLREAEDRSEAGPRHERVGALALPIGEAVRLEAEHRLGRHGRVQSGQRQGVERLAGPDPGRARLLFHPGPRQRRLRATEEEYLLSVTSKARLHKELRIALAVRTGHVEADRAALGRVAQKVLDEAEPRVT